MSIVSTDMPTLLGLALACVLAAVIAAAALILWIKVSKLQALKISTAYIGFAIAYSLLISLIFRDVAR